MVHKPRAETFHEVKFNNCFLHVIYLGLSEKGKTQSRCKAFTRPTKSDSWLDPFYKLLNGKYCQTQNHEGHTLLSVINPLKSSILSLRNSMPGRLYGVADDNLEIVKFNPFIYKWGNRHLEREVTGPGPRDQEWQSQLWTQSKMLLFLFLTIREGLFVNKLTTCNHLR